MSFALTSALAFSRLRRATALEVLDRLLRTPDADPQPAGDLGIVSDLGMSADDLGILCDDDDLYPDEILSDLAARLGFGEAFDLLVG